MCGFYPQTPNDELLLDNFRDVVSKYRSLCLDGLIVLPKNGKYARIIDFSGGLPIEKKEKFSATIMCYNDELSWMMS